jgi:thioredoxin-related protein
MKALMIVIFLWINTFALEQPMSDEPKVFLEQTSKYAIKIGNGKSKLIYVFVDPKCKYSKRLMTKITENKMLQLTNTYYIYLYRLPRLDSKKLIYYIYQSDDPKSTLIDVMVYDDLVELEDFHATDKTKREVQIISDMAKKLDMTLRPYMISFEKDSEYCTVSEGSASCLEEFGE